jgi:hypothetical protein
MPMPFKKAAQADSTDSRYTNTLRLSLPRLLVCACTNRRRGNLRRVHSRL